ncbi:MAG: tRNA (adenosine(37)-N6)-dimethylallyltransferase MiaA [bacterium]|nr:tRNA (adenosine(37)-N6)-dimethylallyltransferase MiaA [bacterium]
MIPSLVIIAGPTSIGKSDVALRIAEELKGEIVSADSRQIYRHMNIGTAKPPLSFLQKIPHYLIDIINPDQEFSASMFKKLAEKEIDTINQRGKVVFLVGGCGLYINAITQGLFPSLPPSKKLREELCKKYSLPELYYKLQEIDKETASKLSSYDKVRIVRALEVFYLSGEKVSALRKYKTIKSNYNTIGIGLNIERDLLYQKINNRVDRMFKEGFVQEVKNLLNMGYHENLSSMKSLGYKQVVKYLKGETDLEGTKLSMKKETRNYAKRQITWFKNKEKLEWFEPKEVDKIIKIIKDRLRY